MNNLSEQKSIHSLAIASVDNIVKEIEHGITYDKLLDKYKISTQTIRDLQTQIAARNKRAKDKIDTLRQLIEKLPKKGQPYANLTEILADLESILSNNSQDCFKNKERDLNTHLNALQQNGYLVVNILLTVLACIFVVGIPILAINGTLEENQKRRGHFLSFFASTEYEHALAAVNECRAVFG